VIAKLARVTLSRTLYSSLKDLKSTNDNIRFGRLLIVRVSNGEVSVDTTNYTVIFAVLSYAGRALMILTKKQVGEILDACLLSHGNENWRRKRANDHHHWRAWINPRALCSCSDGELKQNFLEYVKAGAGRHRFVSFQLHALVADMPRLRIVLQALLDQKTPLVDRINAVLQSTGRHYTYGFGRALATSILMDSDPREYLTWNNATEIGLSLLGSWPLFQSSDSPGQKYAAVLKESKSIRSCRPQLTMLELDFLFWSAVNDPLTRAVITHKMASHLE